MSLNLFVSEKNVLVKIKMQGYNFDHSQEVNNYNIPDNYKCLYNLFIALEKIDTGTIVNVFCNDNFTCDVINKFLPKWRNNYFRTTENKLVKMPQIIQPLNNELLRLAITTCIQDDTISLPAFDSEEDDDGDYDC